MMKMAVLRRRPVPITTDIEEMRNLPEKRIKQCKKKQKGNLEKQ